MTDAGGPVYSSTGSLRIIPLGEGHLRRAVAEFVSGARAMPAMCTARVKT